MSRLTKEMFHEMINDDSLGFYEKANILGRKTTQQDLMEWYKCFDEIPEDLTLYNDAGWRGSRPLCLLGYPEKIVGWYFSEYPPLYPEAVYVDFREPTGGDA